MRAGAMKPLTRNSAESAALDFAAKAALGELAFHAKIGEVRDAAMPAYRPSYDAAMAMIRAQRRMAVTLMRFSWGDGPWDDVEVADRELAICRNDLDRRTKRSLEEAGISPDGDDVLASLARRLSSDDDGAA